MHACLQQAAEEFSAISRRCWDSLAEKLQKACAEKLSGVKGIAAMYRFKKDVPLPTEPSSYIVNVLQPLRTVVKDAPEGDAEHVSRAASSIVASCAAFYVKEAADILPAILKTEESLSKLKKFGKAASSTVCLDLQRFELNCSSILMTLFIRRTTWACPMVGVSAPRSSSCFLQWRTEYYRNLFFHFCFLFFVF